MELILIIILTRKCFVTLIFTYQEPEAQRDEHVRVYTTSKWQIQSVDPGNVTPVFFATMLYCLLIILFNEYLWQK